MTSIIKSALAFAFLATPILSQSEYLNKGQSGGAVSLQFYVREDEDLGISLVPGFSYLGLLDFQAIISKTEMGFEIFESTRGGNSLGAGLGWFFVKEAEKIPLSLAAKGTYLYGKSSGSSQYSYDTLFNYVIHQYKRTVEIELLGSKYWKISPTYILIPELGFSYQSLTLLGRYNNPPVNTDPGWEETRRTMILGFKLGFQTELGKNASFIWTAETNLGNWGIGTDLYDEGLGINSGGFAVALLFYK